MATSHIVETPLGAFEVITNSPTRGTVLSRDLVSVDGRDFVVAASWKLVGADRALILNPLGVSTRGTFKQAAQGGWEHHARRVISEALGDPIRALSEEP